MPSCLCNSPLFLLAAVRILSFVSADFDPAIGWCGREFVFDTAGSRGANRMPAGQCEPAYSVGVPAVSVGWLICDQLPDEARVCWRVTSVTGSIPQPNGMRRDVARCRPHSPLPTPTRPTSTPSHSERASSIAAVSYQQFPSLYQIAARMLPIVVGNSPIVPRQINNSVGILSFGIYWSCTAG